MKNFTLMLASLWLSVGMAFADQLVSNGVYTIEGGSSTQHRGFLAAGEGYADYPVLSDIGWTDYQSNQTTAIENGKMWYIKSTNEGATYYIYNVALGKFLTVDGSNVNFGDEPYGWEIVENTQGGVTYQSIKYVSMACGWSPSQRNVRYHWEASDGGSTHTLTLQADGASTFAEAIAGADAKISEFETPIFDEAKAYKLRHNFSGLYFNMEIDGIGDASGLHCASLQDEANASVVYFVKHPTIHNQWQIRVGSSTGNNLSSDSSWHSIINSTDGYYWSVTEFEVEGSDEKAVVFTRTGNDVNSTNVLGPNLADSYTAGTALWSNQDGSNSGKLNVGKFVAVEAPMTDKLAASISTAEAMVALFKDDTPGFYSTSSEAYSALNAAISSANETLNSESVTAEAVDEAIAALEAAMAADKTVALTGPFNGVYTITNKDGNSSRGYLCYVETIEEGYVWASTKVKTGEGNNGVDVTVPTVDTDNAKWAFVEINGELLLFNIANKSFIRPTGTGANTGWMFYKDQASPISLATAEPGYGTVEISSDLDGVNYYMSISTYYATPVGGYYAQGDGGVPFVFERVGDLSEELRAEMASMNPTTAIEEAEVATPIKQGIYDLQGRRLSAPVKGINIINGKKVLVK